MSFIGTAILHEEATVFVVEAGVVRFAVMSACIVVKRVLYAAAEAGKFGRIVAYGNEACLGFGNFVYTQIVAFAIPRIDVAGVFQDAVQTTDAQFTEAAFQADEGLAVAPTGVSTGDRCFLLNLPNGFQAVTEVFLAFEADFRTQINDAGSGCNFSNLAVLVKYRAGSFYAGFDGAVQGNVSHCCNRKGCQSQGNQGFFHCCIPFLVKKFKPAGLSKPLSFAFTADVFGDSMSETIDVPV
ncbi:hypothetical protein NM477_2237 [Neisseria meningitidis NM477]|nr:hypothetical protein NM477_2237 [Neisseria meningitidis NM477]